MTRERPVIRIEHLSKAYSRTRAGTGDGAGGVPGSLRELLSGVVGSRGHGGEREVFRALDDVSFEVHEGETVGLVGANGAGKSTLLKILSRITPPSEGRVEIVGRVASLLEVGTGFHPELTGRENVFINGAVLGLRRAEVAARFEEIVAFSGVGEFIDTPVKRYSSGMQVRLAFAVAAFVEPEVLIVDEVLAVGDAAFQRKCLTRMGELRDAGRTILFVSHNMAAVEALCTRAVLLHAGRVVLDGNPEEVIARYLAGAATSGAVALGERSDRQGSGSLRFTAMRLKGAAGEATDVLRAGEPLRVELDFVCAGAVRAPLVSLTVYDARLTVAFHMASDLGSGGLPSALPERGTLMATVEKLPLMPGGYSINVYSEANGEIADWVTSAMRFTVEAGNFFGTATGKLPPATHHSVLVEHRFDLVGD